MGGKVLISVSSAVYDLLLEKAKGFQRSWKPTSSASGRPLDTVDGDDVYFCFGGATPCDMLHQHYKQLKFCENAQRDAISQVVTVLQANNIKTRQLYHNNFITMIGQRGFMYFPDIVFILFL